MRFATIFGTILALTAAIGSCLWGNSSYSAQRWHSLLCLPDLVDATTTFKAVNVWGATYYYHQRTAECRWTAPEGNYYPAGGVTSASASKTPAHLWDAQSQRRAIDIGEVKGARKDSFRDVWPPVTRAKLTIGLRPVRNPRFSGVYLFGVTAYPVGEIPRSISWLWTTSLLRRW